MKTKRNGKLRRMIPWIVGLSLVVLVVLGLLPQPILVTTAPVTEGPLVVSVLEEGKTRIRNRHVITPPVSGFLNRVSLRAGDRIEAGETVLATLQGEGSGFLDARSHAQAQARVRMSEASTKLRQEELARAKSMLELARKDLARIDKLYQSKAISVQEWDAATILTQVREREVSAAEFALQVALFEEEQARAALLQGEKKSGDEALTILAPVSGYVLQVFEENARVVTPQTPIMEVGNPDDLEAEIELLSSDAVGIQPGAEVWIEQWGGDNALQGRVSLVEKGGFTKISALGVEEQRVRVRVDFVEPFPDAQKPGDRYRVEARIVTWKGHDVLQIPVGALFRRGNEWMVYVAENGKAHTRKVEIGRQNGFFAQVLDGLKEGESVVLYPPDVLRDGDRIKE
jgi:HlyD family secretion protein